MSDKPDTGQAEAPVDARPPLDAIAEDLVMSTPEDPKDQPAPAETEPTLEQETAPDVSDVDQDPDPETPGEDQEFDFLDSLTGPPPLEAAPTQQGEEDDPVYRVTVDGEEREVTLSDLKRNFSGVGAVDGRIQEATEIRKAAEEYVQAARATQERLQHVYNHYNQAMFAPQVPEPDPALIEQDPIAYNQQLAYWQQDRARIERERGEVQQTLESASQIFQENRRDVLKAESEALYTKMPGLKNPDQAKVFRHKIAEVAKAHGFSPQEVSAADDHRMLTLAAEAAAYRDLKAKLGKGEPAATTKKRSMPSRGDNRPKSENSRRRNQKRKLMDKARQSGSVDDVALTLLQ